MFPNLQGFSVSGGTFANHHGDNSEKDLRRRISFYDNTPDSQRDEC
jgi:hypothetical protein